MALVMGNMIGSGVFLLPASLAPYRRRQPARLDGFGRRVDRAGARLRAAGAVLADQRRTVRLHPARVRRSRRASSSRGATGSRSGPRTRRSPSRSSATSIPSSRRSSESPPLAALLAIAVIWLLTLVNMLGVRVAGRVQLVTTVLKLMPLRRHRHRRTGGVRPVALLASPALATGGVRSRRASWRR